MLRFFRSRWLQFCLNRSSPEDRVVKVALLFLCQAPLAWDLCVKSGLEEGVESLYAEQVLLSGEDEDIFPSRLDLGIEKFPVKVVALTHERRTQNECLFRMGKREIFPLDICINDMRVHTPYYRE